MSHARNCCCVGPSAVYWKMRWCDPECADEDPFVTCVWFLKQADFPQLAIGQVWKIDTGAAPYFEACFEVVGTTTDPQPNSQIASGWLLVDGPYDTCEICSGPEEMRWKYVPCDCNPVGALYFREDFPASGFPCGVIHNIINGQGSCWQQDSLVPLSQALSDPTGTIVGNGDALIYECVPSCAGVPCCPCDCNCTLTTHNCVGTNLPNDGLPSSFMANLSNFKIQWTVNISGCGGPGTGIITFGANVPLVRACLTVPGLSSSTICRSWSGCTTPTVSFSGTLPGVTPFDFPNLCTEYPGFGSGCTSGVSCKIVLACWIANGSEQWSVFTTVTWKRCASDINYCVAGTHLRSSCCDSPIGSFSNFIGVQTNGYTCALGAVDSIVDAGVVTIS